jgi:O-antigen ligase
VLALFVPELGLMTSLHEGAWRGPFSHKNILSRFMVLGAVVYYLRSLDARAARRWGLRFGIAACVAVVILARSATALVVLSALALAVVPLSRLAGARPSYRLLVPAITVAALLATGLGAWALENRAIIFATLGRDETLTGRTLLWSGAIELARQRPWLGYGYGGFWSGESGAGGTLWRIVQWDPTHAHNGLLDVWLDLGLVGVVVFATGAVALWLRALGRAGLDASPAGRWPLLFLSYILAYSLTESDLLRHNGLLWALFVATALAPHRSRGEHSVSGETGAVPGMRRGASLSRWRRHRSTPSGHRSQ